MLFHVGFEEGAEPAEVVDNFPADVTVPPFRNGIALRTHERNMLHGQPQQWVVG